MDFLAGFIFGAACCAIFAGALFNVKARELDEWLTTPSDDVKVFESGDGVKISMVTIR